MIDLTGMDKAEVLAKLFNASKQQGMGFVAGPPGVMTADEARGLLKNQTYFDYLKGKVMKVDLSGGKLDPRLYDRDNGPGAAERALKGKS